MFAACFPQIVDLGHSYKDWKDLHPFTFIKKFRSMVVQDECLKNIIQRSEFPITIGEESFSQLKQTNKRLMEYSKKINK
jgi:hypothetical protein